MHDVLQLEIVSAMPLMEVHGMTEYAAVL